MGYIVLHGTVPQSYFESCWAGIATSFDFPLNETGMHYFAIKVLDGNGNESSPSAEVSISVP